MPDTDRDDLGESYDSFHFFSLKNTYGKNTQELHLLWSWVWTLNTSENGTANYYTLCYWNPRPPTLCWEQRILGVVGENTGESDRPLLWGSRSVGFLIWSREKTSAHGAVQCFQAVCVKPSISWTWLRCESHERTVLKLRLPCTRVVIQWRPLHLYVMCLGMFVVTMIMIPLFDWPVLGTKTLHEAIHRSNKSISTWFLFTTFAPS